jgi:hypothetical protein
VSNKIKMALTILIMLSLAACVPMDRPGDSQKPPGKDWFGNPLPTSDPTCAVTGGEAPVEIPKPAPELPEGWKQAIIVLRVFVLGQKAHKFGGVGQLCLPVGIHVYGSVAGQPGLKIDEAGTPRPLPWDGIRTTPWSSTLVVQYDATKIGSPVVQINLIATWILESGIRNSDLPDVGLIELNCDMDVNGRSVRAGGGWGTDPYKAIIDGKGSKTVRCEATFSV